MENRKKDQKVFYLIFHQAEDKYFDKISRYSIAKYIKDLLERNYKVAEKIKKKVHV